MKKFKKVYSGFMKDIEKEVNNYARKNHLIIASSSRTIKQGKIFMTITYEKPSMDV